MLERTSVPGVEETLLEVKLLSKAGYQEELISDLISDVERGMLSN